MTSDDGYSIARLVASANAEGDQAATIALEVVFATFFKLPFVTLRQLGEAIVCELATDAIDRMKDGRIVGEEAAEGLAEVSRLEV